MRNAVLAAALAVVAILAYPADGALLLHYTFDETGSETALDTGASPAANGTYNGSSSRVTPGVGGSGGAFSTGEGTLSNYLTAGDADKLDGLTQFTITGFIKLSAVNQFDRLVSKHSPNSSDNSGFDLSFEDPSSGSLSTSNLRFKLAVNASEVMSVNTALPADEYAFFAVSFDGTKSSDNVIFYQGSETASVVAKGTRNLTQSMAKVNAADLRVGGTARAASDQDRTPVALFDDIRIYNEILDRDALEAVRLSAVPEPATAALALAGIGLMGLRRKRA